jgi:hypothetical protein
MPPPSPPRCTAAVGDAVDAQAVQKGRGMRPLGNERVTLLVGTEGIMAIDDYRKDILNMEFAQG